MAKASKDFAALVNAKLATLRDGNVVSNDKHKALTRSIAGRSATLDVDIHSAAVAALHIMIQHGDASGVERCMMAVGKAVRAKTLAGWFERYSNAVLTFHKKDERWAAKLRPVDDRMDHDALEDVASKALTDPFWTKPEKGERNFFDDTAMLKAVQAIIEKAGKETAQLSPEAQARILDLKVVVAKLAPADA